MNTQHTTAVEQWVALVAQARTPQEHACLMVARQLAGTGRPEEARSANMVDVYRTALASGEHADLDRQTATAAQADDLARIAEAGDKGLHGRHVDGTTRKLLLRRGWITCTARDGKPAPASDWAAVLHVTFAGRAVCAAALSNPIELNDAQAAPLAAIDRAGPEGYFGWWPAPPGTYRVARRFGLMIERRPYKDAAPDWFLLVPAGREALQRWRARPRRRVLPTKTQADLLGELIAGQTKTRKRMYPTGTYDACEANQWVRWGEKDESGRRPLFITAAGREAHDAYRQAPARPPRVRHPRVTVSELREGQQVRLANRVGCRNLDGSWVTVERLVNIPRQGHMPGGWQVFVRQGGEPVLYAGMTFHAASKFEVKG